MLARKSSDIHRSRQHLKPLMKYSIADDLDPVSLCAGAAVIRLPYFDKRGVQPMARPASGTATASTIRLTMANRSKVEGGAAVDPSNRHHVAELSAFEELMFSTKRSSVTVFPAISLSLLSATQRYGVDGHCDSATDEAPPRSRSGARRLVGGRRTSACRFQ